MISSQGLSGCATARLASIGSPAEHRLFLPQPAPLSLVLPEDRQRMTPGWSCAPKKHSGVKVRSQRNSFMFTLRRYTSADHESVEIIHVLVIQLTGTYLG